jgi:PAS domain S-box-containing protein
VCTGQVFASLHRMQRQLATSVATRADALAALEDNNRRIRTIAETAFDLIAEVDERGRIYYASPSFKQVLGYEPQDLLGRGLDLVHPDDLAVIQRLAPEFSRTGAIAHPPIRLRHRDGSWCWLEGTTRRYELRDGSRRVIVVNRDITAAMQVAAALKASETRFRILTEQLRDVVAELDGKGRFVYVSPNVERLFGYKPEQFVGHTLAEVASFLGSPRADEARDGIAALSQPAPVGWLTRIRAADGSWRWIETDASVYEANGELRAIEVNRDVTERVRLEERLRETQKLESLGLLAGGVAHDFNNLLVPILGNASLLRARLEPGSDAAQLAMDLEAGAEQAAALTQQLLAYAGRRPQRAEPLDLSQLADHATRLIEKTLPSNLTLRRLLPAGLPPVLGDPSQLSQVLLNLLSNAVEAMLGSGGVISVETGATDADERTPASGVYLRVSDEGCGMSESVCERMFDPFYSTKQPGRGLGLAVVQGILRSHRATVSVDSRPGGGTSLLVVLPVAEAVGQPAVRCEPVAAPKARGTVLVVDDEDLVRRLASETLRAAGYTVLQAADGEEALACIRAREDLACVVVDVTMPRRGGDQVWDEIQGLRPELPVLFSSGFASEDLSRRLPREGCVGFLQKPYRASDLVNAVVALTAPVG